MITAPHIFEDLWAEAGRDVSDYVEMMKVSPFYRLFWEDGHRFDYDGDEDDDEDQGTPRMGDRSKHRVISAATARSGTTQRGRRSPG